MPSPIRRVALCVFAACAACTGTAGEGFQRDDSGLVDAGPPPADSDSGQLTGADDAGRSDSGVAHASGMSVRWADDDGGTLILVENESATLEVIIDGGNPPFAYTWSSSLRGALDAGARLSLATLGVGDHTLRLIALDASGARADAGTREAHVLPARFDWSHQLIADAPPATGNWLTSVKNQLTCGSCWSHAALGAMEARWKIQNQDPSLDIDLSEQFLIDCHRQGAVGCGGGAPEQALQFIASNGVPEESCDPFLAHNDTCHATCIDGGTPRLWTVASTRFVLGTSAADVQRLTRDDLVHDGPVPRSLTGMYGWNSSTLRCDNLQGSHYVVLVGYDHTEGVWLAKNSWGPSWNGNGYFKIKYGACGLDAASFSFGRVISP